MIRELRKLAKTNRAKANYIRALQNRGVLEKIVNENGYACYDTEELKHRQKTVKWGRPVKIKKGE